MSKQSPLRLAIVRSGALKQQHHLTTLCQYLVTQGIQIEFISFQAPASEVAWFGEQVPGIKTHALGQWDSGGMGRFIRGGRALRNKLISIQFDILYIIDSWTLPFIFIATAGSMKFGKSAVVYHTFDMIIPQGHGHIYCGLERYMARRSQLNVNTDRSRAEVGKMMYDLKETPLSVPLRMLQDTVLPDCDNELRASFLGSGDTRNNFLVVYPTVIQPSRLSRQVISSFSELPSTYHLVTVDAGGVYAQECRNDIKLFGLEDRVHLLSPMPHEKILELCACADIGLIFHDMDAGIGNYFCHPGRLAYFVALGLPVVASDVPALASLIYRYSLGTCCNPHEPVDMARAIKEICEGDIELRSRRVLVRDAFLHDLHYERSAKRLVDNLSRLRPQNFRAFSEFM